MHRSERLEEQLREEIIQLVEYELDDPRLTPVTITDLKLSENHRDAKVFFAVTGSEQEAAAALAALRHAAPYVRKQLGLTLSLRHVPDIHFVRDKQEERAARVDSLLNQLHITNVQGDEARAKHEEGEALPPKDQES
jgi:ribosome-binding factor A